LDLLDDYRIDFGSAVGGFSVHGLDDLAIVRADEKHIVRLAAWSLHLRVDSDLSESVAKIKHP